MENNNALVLLSKYKKELMGFSALWILVFHVCENSNWNIPEILLLWKRIGYTGVDIFFLLSGIGMTYSIKKSNTWSFYLRRAKKLLPPYVLVGVVYAIEGQWSLLGFIANVSGYKFYTEDVHSLLWFVPAIGTMYLFFPLFYRAAEKSGEKITFFIGVIVVWAFLSPLLIGTLREDLYLFTNRIPDFIAGIIIGILLQEGKTLQMPKNRWVLVGLINILSLYLAYLTNYRDYFLFVPYSRFAIPSFLTAISLSLLFSKGLDILYKSRHTKGTRIVKTFLTFYGGISLEIYCVHPLLRDHIFSYREGSFWTGKFVLLFITNTIIALLVHEFFKRVFMLLEKGGTRK